MRLKNIYKALIVGFFTLCFTMALYAWRNNGSPNNRSSIKPEQGKELFQRLFAPYFRSDSNYAYKADISLYPSGMEDRIIESMTMEYRRMGDTIHQRIGSQFSISYASINCMVDTSNKFIVLTDNGNLTNTADFNYLFSEYGSLLDSANYMLIDSGKEKSLEVSTPLHPTLEKIICQFDATRFELYKVYSVWRPGFIENKDENTSFTTKISFKKKAGGMENERIYSRLRKRIIESRVELYEQEGYRIIR